VSVKRRRTPQDNSKLRIPNACALVRCECRRKRAALVALLLLLLAGLAVGLAAAFKPDAFRKVGAFPYTNSEASNPP
jgi:hypothetical protein